MHILYIYDELNISGDEVDLIKLTITKYLSTIILPTYFNNIIFQIVYFDKEKNRKKKEEELINNVKKETVEKLRKENEETIAKLRRENEEKDDIIKRYKKLLEKNNIPH